MCAYSAILSAGRKKVLLLPFLPQNYKKKRKNNDSNEDNNENLQRTDNKKRRVDILLRIEGKGKEKLFFSFSFIQAKNHQRSALTSVIWM